MSTYFVTGKYRRREEKSYYTHISDFDIIIDIDAINSKDFNHTLKCKLADKYKLFIELISINNIVKL